MSSVSSPQHRAAIVGTGSYAPERVVPNSYFDELYQRDMDTFLRNKRNIIERRWMSSEQATSDLIVPAAQQALNKAQLQVNDLDLIIVATDTPDYLSPSTAAVVQHKLGAKKAGTFDLNTACAGFVTALDVGARYIESGRGIKNILVVGAYGMSKFLNMDDYKISSLFADGAGAAVLQARTDGSGIMAAEFYTDGQYHDYMGIYAGGTHLPVSHEVIENKQHLLNFAKKIPIETNGTHWPRLTHRLLDRIERRPADIATFFFTQINIESIHEALDNLGLPHSKSHNIMDRYGYTGSAAIGMAIDDAAKQQRLKKGDLIFLLGSGGGLSMTAMAMEWAYDT